MKQRRESYLCSPNRGAVSDVCGGGGGVWGLDRGAFVRGGVNTLAGSAPFALCCGGWALIGGSWFQEFH